MLEAFYWQNRFSSKLIDLLLVIIGFTTSYKHKTKYWVVVRVNSSHDTKCGVGLLFIQNKLPQKNLDFQNIWWKSHFVAFWKKFSVIKTLKGIFYNKSPSARIFFLPFRLARIFFRAFWLAQIFFLVFSPPPPHHFSNGPSLKRAGLVDLCSKNSEWIKDYTYVRLFKSLTFNGKS